MKLLFDQNLSRRLVALVDSAFPESRHVIVELLLGHRELIEDFEGDTEGALLVLSLD